MKLKKIASLALAGIMAVSMLAGCSNGNGGNDGETVVVPSDMTGKVIAALDEDTTKNVTFQADASLQTVLEKVVKNKGTSVSAVTLAELQKVEPNLVGDDQLVAIGNKNDKDTATAASKTDKYTFVMNNGWTDGASEEYIAKEIASKIDNAVASGKIGETKKSQTFTYADDDFHYEFNYTGDVAVAEVTDTVTGVTSYVAVCTITRSANKVVE